MANICYTSYRLLGSLESILPFWEIFSHFDREEGYIGLRFLSEAFGIPSRESAAFPRGSVWDANFFPNDEAGLGEIHLETETDGGAPHSFLQAALRRLDRKLSVSYLSVQVGADRFTIHDEANFFGFTHYVVAGGRLFSTCGGAYEDLASAVHTWCTLMHFDRAGRTDEEMMQLINGYEYGDEHWDEVQGYDRFTLHPFTFE